MIEIEIDCNSDMITLYEDNKVIMHQAVKYPNNFIDLFSEIFNRLIDTTSLHNSACGIKITKIDEDKKRDVEEW